MEEREDTGEGAGVDSGQMGATGEPDSSGQAGTEPPAEYTDADEGGSSGGVAGADAEPDGDDELPRPDEAAGGVADDR